LRQTPLGQLTALPDPLYLRGLLLKGGREGRKRNRKGGKGNEVKGKGGEGKRGEEM